MPAMPKRGLLHVTKDSICKIDEDLGLVFGWLMVCKADDAEAGDVDADARYFDTQGDHLTQDAMLAAAAEFMIESRTTKAMHDGGQRGTAVFAFPITDEICKAFGITCPKRGLLFAAKPDVESLEKFRDGTYTGFSIGGIYVERIPVEAE